MIQYSNVIHLMNNLRTQQKKNETNAADSF